MGSNIGGFVNGFVKQVNRNTEAAKMAEYEQSIYDRKRQDELEDWRADNKALIDRDTALFGQQTSRDTALFAANEAAAKLENDNKLVAITDAEKKEIAQLTETLIALNPEFANDPEALAMALKSGTDGLYLYTNSQFRYQPDGSLMSAKDIVDRDTREYVMASAPLSWRDNPAWMNTEAAIEFAERVRSEGGRSGLATFNDAGMSFENILDEDGNVIGARIARPAAEGPEQYRLTAADNEEFIDLKREAYNSFNRIMKLTLGENNVPLTPGVYTSVVEGVTGLAAAAYSNAQTQRIPGTNPSLSFDTTFKAMFGEKHEDLRQLDDAHLAIGANAIAAYVADPTSLSNLPAAELLEIYENIRVRNKVTLNVPNVDLTEQRGTFVLNDILRDIEANPGFITEYGSDEQRAELAELTPAITPVVPAPAPSVTGGPGPAGFVEPTVAFVDPDELYSITNGIGTTKNTAGDVFYSYDNEEGQKKMDAAVKAFIAYQEEQKSKVGVGAIGSQRDLQSFIAEAFGLRAPILGDRGNPFQRKVARDKRASALAQLEEQWRKSVET
jgi:hypothetical protein